MGRTPVVCRRVSRPRSLLGAAIVAGVVAAYTGPLHGQRPVAPGLERVNGRPAAAGEAIVRLRPAASARAVVADVELDVDEALAAGVRRIRSRRLSTAQLIARLNGRPDVLYAEPNYLLQIAALPNDPYLTEQWAFRDPLVGPGIDAVGAWTIATGSRRHVVGLVDTGVDYTHPDLRGNIWSAPAAFTVSVGGVSITCPAGSHGFDAILMTCDPTDTHGHGTRMAGLIGATGNNGIGVSGLNWTAAIMPLRFMDQSGTGWTSDAVKAMEFAVQAKRTFGSAADVRILSNSWTGPAYSRALNDQVVRAGAHDMLVVAAAGNDGLDTDISPVYPAGLDLPNVISVAATDAADRLEPYSNYGALSVDIAAPGHGIVSTYLAGGYSSGDGTSPAAALTAGSAALVLSHCALSANALRTLIVESVDVLGALAGRTETGGRLNVGRAVRSCSNGNTAPQVALVTPLAQQRFVAPAAVSIAAEASDSDGSIARVEFFVGSTQVAVDTTAPYGATWTATTPGTYVIRAVAVDNQGATAEAREPRTIVVESATPLPAPWQTRDIGSVGAAGGAAVSGNRVVVQGAGADVWGTADAFRFVYRALEGDGRITAQVTSLDFVDAWTKAGVMIRSSLQPGAAQAFMLVSPANGFAFQQRPLPGASTLHTSGGTGAPPAWVRLERQGSTVRAWKSADGSAWTVVGQAEVALGATAYIGVAVTSHRAGVLASAVFDSVAVTASVSAPALPSGWAERDIGAVAHPGSASTNAGSFTLSGAGADIWGTADAFHFAYRPLPGDGQIVARVAALQAADPWAKAGVMIRQSLEPDSPHALMAVTPGHGLAFQRRVSAGGQTTHTAAGTGSAPAWVGLVRRGQSVRAFRSTDGVTWTLVGEDTLALSGAVYVGLAVTSHDPDAAAGATFTDVAIE